MLNLAEIPDDQWTEASTNENKTLLVINECDTHWNKASLQVS